MNELAGKAREILLPRNVDLILFHRDSIDAWAAVYAVSLARPVFVLPFFEGHTDIGMELNHHSKSVVLCFSLRADTHAKVNFDCKYNFATFGVDGVNISKNDEHLRKYIVFRTGRGSRDKHVISSPSNSICTVVHQYFCDGMELPRVLRLVEEGLLDKNENYTRDGPALIRALGRVYRNIGLFCEMGTFPDRLNAEIERGRLM